MLRGQLPRPGRGCIAAVVGAEESVQGWGWLGGLKQANVLGAWEPPLGCLVPRAPLWVFQLWSCLAVLLQVGRGRFGIGKSPGLEDRCSRDHPQPHRGQHTPLGSHSWCWRPCARPALLSPVGGLIRGLGHLIARSDAGGSPHLHGEWGAGQGWGLFGILGVQGSSWLLSVQQSSVGRGSWGAVEKGGAAGSHPCSSSLDFLGS